MKKYEIGLYEKAMRNTLTWKEKLQCAKECGYDYLEISIDATEEKINRIYMDSQRRKAIFIENIRKIAEIDEREKFW